jgi:hypothetical protein
MTKKTSKSSSSNFGDSVWYLLLAGILIPLLGVIADWLGLIPLSLKCQLLPFLCEQLLCNQYDLNLLEEGQSLIYEADQDWAEYLKGSPKRRSHLGKIRPQYDQVLNTFERVSPDCLSNQKNAENLIKRLKIR